MIQYNEQFDSYYDDESNEWIESTCGDPECEYCTKRPEKPLSQINPTICQTINTTV